MSKKLLSFAAAVTLLAMVLLTIPVFAGAETASELLSQLQALEQEQKQLQSEIQQLEDSLAENYGQVEAMVAKKNTLDTQITLLYRQSENTDLQIAAHRLLMADTQEDLEQAQEKLDTLRDTHKKRLRVVEEHGQMSYWTVLVSSMDMSDFLDRLVLMLEIMRADRQRLEQLQQATEEIRVLQEQLKQDADALNALKQEQQLTLQTLEEKRADADTLLQSLVAKGDAYDQLLLESEEKQEQLMAQIAKTENEYDAQAELEWLATSVPETTADHTTEQTQGMQSQWINPVPYYTLTSPFGMRLHPILGIYRMHNGVDLGCAMNTPIYAARSGIVSVTDYEEAGAGNYIQINHGDGYRSVYMHMTYYTVSLGQRVEAGQIVGYVGSTGLSDGPHLHFGISYNGTYVNPMAYIG